MQPGAIMHTHLHRALSQACINEPVAGHFRDFKSPRVHTRINSWGLDLAESARA